jgi:hypothetical protein
VGNTGVFADLSEVWDRLAICGAGGDIVLEIETGIYHQSINLSDISLLMGNNKLTITSATGRMEDVEFVTSAVGLVLSNSNNIVIKNITIDASKGVHAVQFVNPCSNVLIRDCRLLADTTTNLTRYAIYKATVNVLQNISIINNIIEGGNDGINLNMGTGSGIYGKGLVIDSNTISKQYSAAIRTNYADSISISGNIIRSRTANIINTTWYGIYLSYCNGNITNNRIRQQSNSITQPQGIYLASFNRSFTLDTGFIANNEIILYTPNASQGINLNLSKARVVHNSIYVGGTMGAARGIQITNNINNYLVVKNNNIVMESPSAYPIYLSSIANLNLYEIDYNNMYAPTLVGYAAANKATIADWQQTITTDKHSISILPSFINPAVDLKLSNYSAHTCLSYPRIIKDIENNFRVYVTSMGAYNGLIPSLDLYAEKVICNDTAVVYPQTVPVSTKIINIGSHDNIDSVTFGWSVNGIIHPSRTWIANTPLAIGQSIEVPVGVFSAGRSSTFDITVWIESVNGQKDSVAWNDTARRSVKVLCTGNNLSILSIMPLLPDGVLCTEDFVSLKAVLANTGTLDYDFSANAVQMYAEVTQPEPFYLDTVISSGILQAGNEITVELTNMFPTVVAGQYDIKIWIDKINNIVYDDTLFMDYLSEKFSLPIDENFSQGMPVEFRLESNNPSCHWQIISQGTGADMAVQPVFGDSILSFKGTPGTMATVSTKQLDLSRTTKPSLSFWYFHDTIPCDDYTDVRITIDGGTTYNTLFSLTKYDVVYGWRQYSMDLPSYAVNQCVILVFEAMEKSRNGDVTQYIDRIRITAKRDIEVKNILTSGLAACDLENKEWKVVLSNNTDPVLDYSVTPTEVTLEIVGTSHTFTKALSTDVLAGFTSDTIILSPTFDFVPGTYQVKAYFSSVLDDDRTNDTLVTFIVIDPKIEVQLSQVSATNTCLAGEMSVYQEITLINTGNMDLSDIELVLQIDTGETVTSVYTIITETYTGTVLPGNSETYRFDSAYSVPWNARYYVRLTTRLACNSVLANSVDEIIECVNIEDVYMVSIDNPFGTTADNIGSSIQVSATIRNRSDVKTYSDVNIVVLVSNSQGVQTEKILETTTPVGILATVSHTFSNSYTVPNDSVYYLSVCVASHYDSYPQNDTITIKRYTQDTTKPINIKPIGVVEGFTLGQNIPNPANNSTFIDYSVPEAGEVIFHVHSISGQLLYSKTIEVGQGRHTLELNTSTLAAGVYFYSIEYKGQRLVKRMGVK